MAEQFEKLRELLAKATPGKWDAAHGGVIEDCYDNSSVLNRPGFGSMVFDDPEHVDAELICELRNRAGELLDAAERTRKAEHELVCEQDRIRDVHADWKREQARCEQLEAALREIAESHADEIDIYKEIAAAALKESQ